MIRLRQQNTRKFLANFLPASQLGASASFCKKPVVDESGIIITQSDWDVLSLRVLVPHV
jgi:hypothetical protein